MSKIVEAIDRLLQGDMTPEARELLQRAKAVESVRAFYQPEAPELDQQKPEGMAE